ncbi:MAG: VOC family protein [Thaumarchaeota archaeon]|nr:VOC family protein [Nitrososphaerota archaeon]
MSNPVVPKMKIGGICQIGIVVRDLQKATDNYWATLGIGPWMTLRIEPPLLRDLTLRGKPVEASMLAAIAQSGSIQLELIEPLEGPSIWKEFLDERGEALHHVQSLVQDPDAALAAFKESGIDVLMSGRIGDSIFYYMDTEPLLGTIYEFVGRTAPGRAQL